MAKYIDKPGIDQAEIISNNRVYPVVMSIPISATSGPEESITSSGVPGFNIPEYDTITTLEDGNGRLQSVSYSYGGNSVGSLSFSYVDDTGTGTPYVFVDPIKQTTITKGA